MKFKKSMLVVLAAGCAFTLPGCNNTNTSEKSEDTTTSETPVVTSTPTSEAEPTATLNMSVMYQDNATRMKFKAGKGALAKATSYTDPAGTTYEAEQFKPVWKALQKNLDFTINDITPDGASISKLADAFNHFKTAGWMSDDGKPVHIAQGTSSDIIKEGTVNKTILNLKTYVDAGKMPNFKSFLEKNPVVAKTITDASGAIYYAPYFDGYDDLERMLMIREDLVEKLLDGDSLPSCDTAKELTSVYTPFFDDTVNKTIDVMKADSSDKETVDKVHTKDVITVQNALTTKNGSTLTQALRDYIDSTYKKADGTSYYGTKRSRLFVGGQSAYDIDELVALYRCVYTNPALLSGNASNTMVPLYPRANTNDRTTDLWRFAAFFGVRGVDSRNGYLYVGADGKLADARMGKEMKNAVGKMHQMYQEGLILNDFTNTTIGKGTFNTALLEAGTGFSSFDYNQTQAAYNSDAKVPSGFLFVPTLPAVYPWNGDSGKWFHFTESWRSVKSDAWFITAQTATDSACLTKALKLFDYLYGDEGNRLMSYGPDEFLAKDSAGKVATIAYQGRQVPKLSDATITQLNDANIGNGNYTNFYRYFLGATYPVGYVKEQGMEYQCVNSKAIPAFDEVNAAIAKNILEHSNFSTTNTNHLYDTVPTTLAMNEAEQTATGSSDYTALIAAFNVSKGKTNNWTTIVESGFQVIGSYDFSEANYLDTINSTGTNKLGCAAWLKYNQDAYTRMMA